MRGSDVHVPDPQLGPQRQPLGTRAGAVGTAALALSTTAALGGLTASITNTGDAASTGTLVMKEVVGSPGTTCLSTGAGTTVNSTNANTACTANKFGGLVNAKPGDNNSTNVVITNVGTIDAGSLTMNNGACAQSNNTYSSNTYFGTDTTFCSKVDVTVEDDSVAGSPRCVYPAQAGACPALANTYNLTTFATFFATAKTILPAATTVTAGNSRTYAVNVGVDAGADNSDQGLTAKEPITFTFGQ